MHPDPDLCDYRFDHDAFDTAREWVLAPGLDVVFLEAGKYEANERGHWRALVDVLEQTGDGARVVVLAVRRSALISLLYKLPEPTVALELPADEDATAAFAAELEALVATTTAARGGPDT